MIKAIVFATGVLSSVAAVAVEPLALTGAETVAARAGYKLEFGDAGDQPLRHSLAFTSGTAQNARPALEYRWTRVSSDLRIGGNSVMSQAPGVSDDDAAPWARLTNLEWVYVISAGSAIIATLLTFENNADNENPSGTGASN